MTRLGQSGFELGDTLQVGSDTVGGSGGTVAIVSATPTARSGTYCLKCTMGSVNNSIANSTSWVGRKTFAHASKTEMWYAFGFYSHHTSEISTPGAAFFRAHDTSGNVNVICFQDAGTIRAYYATAGGSSPTALTLIAAASVAMGADVWNLIEIRIVAATGSTGNFELYLNGAAVISTSSQRTAQTNANLGGFALELNNPITAAPTSVTSSEYHAFDDVRWQDTAGSVNNGRPGDEAIRVLVPNAAGDSTQFSRGGADSGTNYGQVDDIPPNGTTDYVQDSVSGHLDLYNLPTLSIASISAVQVVMQAFNPDGGGGSLYLVTKTTAGQSDGSSISITTTPTYYTRLLETDPFDSVAWNQARLDSLQIGVKVV